MHITSLRISDTLRPVCVHNLMDCSPPGSPVHGDSPGESIGVGCHALLQGIFPTQRLNPGLPLQAAQGPLIKHVFGPAGHSNYLQMQGRSQSEPQPPYSSPHCPFDSSEDRPSPLPSWEDLRQAPSPVTLPKT